MKKNLVIGTISIIVVVAMAAMLLSYGESLDEAIMYLKGANYWILLLLIPNVILMYYAAGRIWYPYLKNDGLSAGELGRIQYELNFVNTVVPAATISGLIYATKRLKAYGIDGGRTAWLYLYRYVVSIVTNWLGIVGAAIILLCLGKMKDMPMLPLVITAVIICLAVAGFVIAVFLLVSKIGSGTFVSNLRTALKFAAENKTALVSSWIWGMIYTIMEDLPFLIVAWSMGYPELFLQMVVAAGAGIIVGIFMPTPGGIGGFEGAMIYLLGGFNTNIALASAIVLVTRVIILVSTTATGYPFWQHGMLKISKE